MFRQIGVDITKFRPAKGKEDLLRESTYIPDVDAKLDIAARKRKKGKAKKG